MGEIREGEERWIRGCLKACRCVCGNSPSGKIFSPFILYECGLEYGLEILESGFPDTGNC